MTTSSYLHLVLLFYLSPYMNLAYNHMYKYVNITITTTNKTLTVLLNEVLYFITMNPMYYRPSLLLGVQLKCLCKTQRSTSFSNVKLHHVAVSTIFYLSPCMNLAYNHMYKYVNITNTTINKTLTVLLNEVLLWVLQRHFSCTPRRRLGL